MSDAPPYTQLFTKNNFMKSILNYGAIALLIIGSLILPVQAASPFARSDILLHIVTQCIDPSIQNYCSQCMSPRLEGHCGVTECKKTTDVWASNDQFVAMRDIKMCGCPAHFVHGLALPKSVVTGVEDPKKPEGIWQFAWDEAAKKIEPESIALVVNPQFHRSQNQLHLHMLRLTSKARDHLTHNDPHFVENLDQVWSVASKAASTKGLRDFGVIVIQAQDHPFMIVVTEYSPEAAFTQWRCDGFP